MDDFGAPNKTCSLCLPPNYIEPGKRPQSSMSPTIMLDRYGKVKLVIGASGGGFIPTGTIQVSSDFVGEILSHQSSHTIGNIAGPTFQKDTL